MLLEKTSRMDDSLPQRINRFPQLKYRYRGSFHSDHVPTLGNDTFAIINTQHSIMQGEHWILIANFCQILCFADSLGRKKTVSSSSNMNRWCQNHYSPITAFAVCTWDTQLFISSNSDKKKLQEYTNVNVHSFISNYMCFFNLFNVNVHVLQCLC